MKIVLILVATTSIVYCARNSFGETALAKSEFTTALTKLCPKFGIDSGDVELEVNQFFECMSESRSGAEPNAPLVIPTSVRQLRKLFNFKRYKNYLSEQCPTFKQKQLCAQRFQKFVLSCNIIRYTIDSPYIDFTTAMAVSYSRWGERVCWDNGKNFMAFIAETDNSCSDPNLYGLLNRQRNCFVFERAEKQKSTHEVISDSRVIRLFGKEANRNIINCVMKSYRDTCTGTTAVELLYQFIFPNGINKTTTQVS